MKLIVKALELTGTVDEKRQLHLDESLPLMGPSRVRVLILVTEEQEITQDEWLGIQVNVPLNTADLEGQGVVCDPPFLL